MYKLSKSFDGRVNAIIRLLDAAVIPVAEDNTDYQQYLAWLAQGNTPLPAEE